MLVRGAPPDPVIVDVFVSEISKLDPARAIPAMKQAVVENKIPSVEDVLKRCGIKVEYGAEPAPKFEQSKDDENEKAKLELPCLTFRIEAPFPQCTDLDASVKYWQKMLADKAAQGWRLETWDEYDGNRTYEEGKDGRLTTTKQRIFYANAHMSRNPNAKLLHCKNHFTGKVQALYV